METPNTYSPEDHKKLREIQATLNERTQDREWEDEAHGDPLDVTRTIDPLIHRAMKAIEGNES